MDESGFEVLGFGPEGDDDASATPPLRQRGVLLVLAAVAVGALIVGGLAGFSIADQTRRSSAPKPSVILSGTVIPATVNGADGSSGPRIDGAGVIEMVDLALINSAPLPLSNLSITWDDVHQAFTHPDEGHTTLRDLAPRTPAAVRLLLRQPCTAPTAHGDRAVPTVVIKAFDASGRGLTTTISPLGLSKVWAEMAAACPSPQSPTSLQVFPHFSAELKIRLRVTDCRSAVEDVSARTISFIVSSADDPTKARLISAANAQYSSALGQLLSRACLPVNRRTF